MKIVKIAITALLITSYFSIRPQNEIKRGKLSSSYHKIVDKCACHKGKVGLAVGVVGTTIVTRIFKDELEDHIKPLIKKLWNKTTNFFRRIFKREEKN